MQRLLEMVSLEEEKLIVYESIKPNIEVLAFDVKGNYVLISSLQVLTQQHFNEIVEIIMGFFDQLVLDQYGICIINKVIQLVKLEEQKERIVGMLGANCIEIVQNSYGNYAITQVLQSFTKAQNKPILKQLGDFFQQLSVQRYSSNVIEKCVERADKDEIALYFARLQEENVLKSMLKNASSYYVIQKIYNKLETEEQRGLLRDLIEKNLHYVTDKATR